VNRGQLRRAFESLTRGLGASLRRFPDRPAVVCIDLESADLGDGYLRLCLDCDDAVVIVETAAPLAALVPRQAPAQDKLLALQFMAGPFQSGRPIYPALDARNQHLVLSYVVGGAACELGFGQGLSLHAAAQPGMQYWGTDFNPDQAAFAQSLAHASGSGTRLFDQSFGEFCTRADLPDFDYIGLHGVWSWVSNENRAIIVDFIRRKLKVGGVLFISYNTLPGWAARIPMRHLFAQHAQMMSAPGQGSMSRIDGAIAFAEKLLATGPDYAAANPQVGDYLSQVKQQDRRYLAHEYFSRDWLPMHFADMAEWLAPARRRSNRRSAAIFRWPR
jgi:SAM-dependent methyltransferase